MCGNKNEIKTFKSPSQLLNLILTTHKHSTLVAKPGCLNNMNIAMEKLPLIEMIKNLAAIHQTQHQTQAKLCTEQK